jgi:site-specific recombinase XerD
MRTTMRLRHMSRYTEQQYVGWVRRYIRFHQKRHPREVGPEGVVRFLSDLAQRRVAAATQNQALNALVFLYRHVLDINLGSLNGVRWIQENRNMPTVLTREEVSSILLGLEKSPTKWLIASLLYSSGMRLIECLRLRIKDIDDKQLTSTIHDGKGEKDRIAPLAPSLVSPLRAQIARARGLWQRDYDEGFGQVSLPNQLQRKYPNADREWK